MRKALLFDLDDTLYAYNPCERAGREAVVAAVAERTGLDARAVGEAWGAARHAVKLRHTTPSAHSRLLYLSELVYACGLHQSIGLLLAWERIYWDAYLGVARLRPEAEALLHEARARGEKVAIVTDLTLAIQLRKLAHLSLLSLVDVLVASEEVGFDKPHPAALDLAVERLGVRLEDCVMIGDSIAKDGGVAMARNVPFYHVASDAALAALRQEFLAS